MAEAEASKGEVMKKFAAGLKMDILAMRAGLTERWSNGPVEGFVHKLKLIKRQGYGRASFPIEGQCAGCLNTAENSGTRDNVSLHQEPARAKPCYS